MAKKKSKKRSGAVTVDFTGVRARVTVPEGIYRAKVTGGENKESSSGNDMIEWEVEILEGEGAEGAKMYHITSLQPQALWNLRSWLESLGVEIPDSEFDVDPDDYVDSTLKISVGHEEYEGKVRAKIVDFMVDDEKEGSKKKKRSDKKAKDEDEDDEEEEKVTVEDDDDEEEEETPKSSKKKSKLPKMSLEELSEMSEKELKQVIKKYELDVDLTDYPKPRKKVSAVSDALEEKGFLAEDDDEED